MFLYGKFTSVRVVDEQCELAELIYNDRNALFHNRVHSSTNHLANDVYV